MNDSEKLYLMEKQFSMAEEAIKLSSGKGRREEEEYDEYDDENVFQMIEKRPFRSFSQSDEYLYAMKEDLCEWLNILYESLQINPENFMSTLETGEHLIKHANAVRQSYISLLSDIKVGGSKELSVPDFRIPDKDIPLRSPVFPGTWFARDNVFNFIKFCRLIGVMECVMFETEDLVCRKNEKHVILTLLDVARKGASLGMLAPLLVQFEKEIDLEIEREEFESRRIVENEKTLEEKQRNDKTESSFWNSEKSEIKSLIEPIGPIPQLVTNDLKSLDEMVRDIVFDCQCPTQFPVIRVSDGKYRIGETRVLIFVRILRKHVMVRVGGGWDTLQHYLDKHDPCRCKAGHRSALSAHISTKVGQGPMAVGIQYERMASPISSRRKLSSFSSRNRSSSATPSFAPSRSSSPLPKTNSTRTPILSRKIVSNKPLFIGKQSISSQMTNRSDSSSSIPSSNPTDSGSEVSDEGYKSSQGTSLLSKHDGVSRLIKPSSESILAEVSDCSSTISSDEEECEKKQCNNTPVKISQLLHRSRSSGDESIFIRKSRGPERRTIFGKQQKELFKKTMEEVLLINNNEIKSYKGQKNGKGDDYPPKDAFEDFTTHWIMASNNNLNSLNSSRSQGRSSPMPRKEFREGYKDTKIPIPLFFKDFKSPSSQNP